MVGATTIERLGGTAAENPHHADRFVIVTHQMAEACAASPYAALRSLSRRYYASPNIMVDDLAIGILVRYQHDASMGGRSLPMEATARPIYNAE